MRTFRLRCLALVGVAALAIVVVPSPSAARPDTASAGDLVAAVNAQRAAHGLAPLVHDSGSSAQCAAEAYRDTGQAHPPGCDWGGAGGEVSAAGRLLSAVSAVTLWLGSASHRNIILDPGGDAIRAGLATSSDGIVYLVVQVRDTNGDWGRAAPPTTAKPPPPPTTQPPPPPPTTAPPTSQTAPPTTATPTPTTTEGEPDEADPGDEVAAPIIRPRPAIDRADLTRPTGAPLTADVEPASNRRDAYSTSLMLVGLITSGLLAVGYAGCRLMSSEPRRV